MRCLEKSEEDRECGTFLDVGEGGFLSCVQTFGKWLLVEFVLETVADFVWMKSSEDVVKRALRLLSLTALWRKGRSRLCSRWWWNGRGG